MRATHTRPENKSQDLQCGPATQNSRQRIEFLATVRVQPRLRSKECQLEGLRFFVILGRTRKIRSFGESFALKPEVGHNILAPLFHPCPNSAPLSPARRPRCSTLCCSSRRYQPTRAISAEPAWSRAQGCISSNRSASRSTSTRSSGRAWDTGAISTLRCTRAGTTSASAMDWLRTVPNPGCTF